MSLLSRLFISLPCLSVLGLFLGVVNPASATKIYTDNLNGTVTDTTTGLIWMRCAMGST